MVHLPSPAPNLVLGDTLGQSGHCHRGVWPLWHFRFEAYPLRITLCVPVPSLHDLSLGTHPAIEIPGGGAAPRWLKDSWKSGSELLHALEASQWVEITSIDWREREGGIHELVVVTPDGTVTEGFSGAVLQKLPADDDVRATVESRIARLIASGSAR